MINVTDLRAGTTFLLDGQPWFVLKYEHIKMGRGGATIKVKAKNLATGSVVEKAFNSGASVEEVVTRKQKLQFLYKNSTSAFFMDEKTYEQVEISLVVLGQSAALLKEGVGVDVLFWNDSPLSVELGPKITLVVAEAEPGIKGDSASNMYKQAVLENGLKIKVPLFIKKGDKVSVDTRTGEYVERVR